MAERRDKAEPSAPRKRALVSCDRCKLRRARCIRNGPDEPCADCKVNGVACESKLPRKQRVYGSVETLSLRYRALEALVKGLFPHEHVQDTGVLFKLAAARNIPMPSSDDFTPADIFINKNTQRLANEQSSQHSQRKGLSSEASPLPSPRTTSGSAPHADTDQSTSTSKDVPPNPFLEVYLPARSIEELVPTRHGGAHYFGPSSSFRLAITIRALIARYRTVAGPNILAIHTTGADSADAAERLTPQSVPHTSTNPFDEEHTASASQQPILPSHQRTGSKRSRSTMEATNDQWEYHGAGSGTVSDLLPSRTLGDALVTAYFDHVHIYFPLFHRSLFQYKFEATYERGSASLKDFDDIGWLICLSMVFSFGCQQLQERDLEKAHRLRFKYLAFSKTYFKQLLRTTRLANVQAFVLLNIHHHTMGQKSSSWLLIGLAARMAITMGMHRDTTNNDLDPIERNTRRQVWWTIYVFEKILCSILGRPTVMDDREMFIRVPDATMLEQKTMSAEFMGFAYKVVRMSYSIRQRAYFDKATAEERSPTLFVAEGLLSECDNFFATIPPNLSVDFTSAPPEQRARILLLHVYYYYTRCIVTRDFLIQKVERRMCSLENKPPPYRDDWDRTLILAEDCVDSAHNSLRCIIAGCHHGMMGYPWLDLFFVFHSILIVCADFLSRPKEERDTPQDAERKEVVRTMLGNIRDMRTLAPTYNIMRQIAIQFASMTGVAEEPVTPSVSRSVQNTPSLVRESTIGSEGLARSLNDISDVQEDWFANATSRLGVEFFDLNQGSGAVPPSLSTNPLLAPGFHSDLNSPAVIDDWTDGTLKGLHQL